MLTTLKRIIHSGWLGFWRNKLVSSAAILMMTFAILGVTALILINVLISSLTSSLENKIDISVYFNLDAEEEEILAARNDLIQLNEVRSVEYVSTEEALARFKEKHADNQILMQSLSELGGNPLEASLNIQAQQASQYEIIAGFFGQDKYQEIVDKINYLENKEVIARLSSITRIIRRSGLVTLLILAVVAVLITFNTIRLTIHNVRKEIKVMKLVGASNWFARGPFLVEGVLYGVCATIFAMLVLAPLLWYVSPYVTGYLPGTDLFYFFQANFFAILLIQLATGVVLGTLSSVLAVRRYLDV